MLNERTLLIAINNSQRINPIKKLTLLNAIICIIDVFGVFPIVTLSSSIINCGLYVGLLVFLIILLLQIYTATLLGRCWMLAKELNNNENLRFTLKERCPYSSLAEITFGVIFAKLTNVFLNFVIFCSGVPNLLMASQNFQLLASKLFKENLHFSFCYWLIIIGIVLCPVLCIGSPKDLRIVCTISITCVLGVFGLICACIYEDDQKKPEDPGTLLDQPFEKLFTLYGMVTFQFDIHPSILTIQVDMKRKKNIYKAIIAGYLGTTTMAAIITVVAYNKYGSRIKPSLLETISPSNYLHITALLVSIQLCLSSAISNCALYETLEEYIDIPPNFNKHRCFLRSGLTLIGILLAETVPKFDVVMSVIGGTLTGPLTFILPPLFYVKLLRISNGSFCGEKLRKAEVIFCLFIAASGTIATIINTYVNISSSLAYTTISTSCLMNITNSFVNS